MYLFWGVSSNIYLAKDICGIDIGQYSATI